MRGPCAFVSYLLLSDLFREKCRTNHFVLNITSFQDIRINCWTIPFLEIRNPNNRNQISTEKHDTDNLPVSWIELGWGRDTDTKQTAACPEVGCASSWFPWRYGLLPKNLSTRPYINLHIRRGSSLPVSCRTNYNLSFKLQLYFT